MMKKFYAHYTDTWYKDEIIIYAKDKREAQRLADNIPFHIDTDYGTEMIKVFDWPPEEKFDKDNTLVITKNKITKPELKPMRTFYGELTHELMKEEEEVELAFLNEKEFASLRKNISKIIFEYIKKAKIRVNKENLKLTNKYKKQ